MSLFVARQPIVDLSERVAGYELLYRNSGASRAADGASSNKMSMDVVIHAFLEIGFERITRGRPAWLNFTREMLLDGSFELLAPEAVVIEVLESIEADEAVTEACARLRREGYHLALDDFTGDHGHEDLLDLAEIVKIDVLDLSPEQIHRAADPIRRRGLRLLAERVESAEVHRACLDAGFELFQGYFFSRPEIVERNGLASDQTAILRLMHLLNDEAAGDEDLERSLQGEGGMGERLLRVVNGSSGSTGDYGSAMDALHAEGRGPLRRALALVLAESLARRGELDRERIDSSLVRARFCELLGAPRLPEVQLFLVGLFSRMDALLRAPMEEIVSQANLSGEVEEALLRRGGRYADLLSLVEAYEAGDWEAVESGCGSFELSPADLPGFYLEALGWAREQMDALES